MLAHFFKTIEKIAPQKWRWILNHEGFKRYFANTGWMFLGQMFSLLVSFFIGAWLARYLGPENYGVLSYAVAFVGLFGFIASLGVDGILNRELVARPEQRDELMGTAFRLKVIGGGVAGILCIASAFIFSGNALSRLLIILFSFTFILQSINVISTYFQAEVKSKSNVKAILLATIISSILKVATILFDKGVIWIIAIFTLDFLWQGIGFIIAYRKIGLKLGNWKFNDKLAKDILKSSLPLMLASAASFIYLRIDQVMIGKMLGDYEVGLYAAAVKLVEVWYFIPGIICASLFPAIVNARKTSSVVYKKRLKALYLLMLGIAFSIAVFSMFLAPWLVSFLFGKAYLAAIIVLQIYIWSNVGLFVGIAINQYFLSENYSNYIFFYNLLSMIVNVGLNLILIPKFGLIGAAWATLIAYSIGPIVTIIISLISDSKITNNKYLIV